MPASQKTVKVKKPQTRGVKVIDTIEHFRNKCRMEFKKEMGLSAWIGSILTSRFNPRYVEWLETKVFEIQKEENDNKM